MMRGVNEKVHGPKASPMRILIVDTFYVPYLERLYADGALAKQAWAQQHKKHFVGGFGTGDAYSYGLGLLDVQAIEMVANSPILQESWARENKPELLQLPRGGASATGNTGSANTMVETNSSIHTRHKLVTRKLPKTCEADGGACSGSKCLPASNRARPKSI